MASPLLTLKLQGDLAQEWRLLNDSFTPTKGADSFTPTKGASFRSTAQSQSATNSLAGVHPQYPKP